MIMHTFVATIYQKDMLSGIVFEII